MPKLKVVKENGQKIYPISIVKGIYDTENSQPLSKTLIDKVGSATFSKAISDSRTFAFIVALATHMGSWNISDNSEFKCAITDSENKVILAKNNSNEWILGDNIDTLLDGILSTDLTSVEKTLADFNITDAYTKDEIDSICNDTTALFDNSFTTKNSLMLAAIFNIISSNISVSVVENYEWKWVLMDSDNKVLLGIRENHTIYQGIELSEILDALVENYVSKDATVGTFANVPTSPSVGQQYFCTDKQTTEGTVDGIPIWYNGTSWVDALGRTVEETT